MKDGWISVEERLPEILGPYVLLWADFGQCPEACKIGFLVSESYSSGIVGVPPAPLWSIAGGFKSWPTHWMPLPAPPKAA